MIEISDSITSRDATLPQHARSAVRKASIVVIYVLIFWVMLPAFLIGTGLRLDALWPMTLRAGGALTSIGWMLAAVGAGTTILSMAQLRLQGKGLPISHLPPTELVAVGLFRYFRHPIYVGYTLALAGVALLIDSFWTLWFSTPLLLIGWIGYTRFYEEPRLIARFGAAYEAHRRRTRLLLPIPRSAHEAPEKEKVWMKLLARLNRLADRTVLFQRGPFILVTYGLFCALGALLWGESISMTLIQQGLAFSTVGWLIVGLSLATSIGADLFWRLGHWQLIRHERWKGWGRLGFVSYGGLLGASVFTAIYAWIHRLQPLMLLDALMQGMYFSYALGRLGCLTYGCCYGACTMSDFAISYTNPDAKVLREGSDSTCARHPVQFYAFLHGVLMIVAIAFIARAPVPAGLLTALTLMLGGLGRTITEFYRDRPHPIVRIFTAGHIGSGVMFLSGWLMLFFITPGVGADAPVPWSWPAFVDSLPLLPAVLVSGVLILLIYGVHWKRLGYRFGG